MKRIFVLTLFLCAALFLFGCDQTTTDSGDATSTDITTSTTDTTTTDTSTDSADSSVSVPTDAEVASAFDDAYTVYEWFDMEPLAVETDDEGNVAFYTVGDNDYCEKVTDANITSMDDLKAAVEKYFSADICDTLLNGGMYMEDNGVLYEIAADRGADITKGDVLSKTVTASSDTSITYTVTVETIDTDTGEATGSEDIDYLYEYVDGQWLFTSFQSIY